MLHAEVRHQSFSEPLALVIAGAGTDGVDVATITLGLGVDFGITVDFGGRSLKEASLVLRRLVEKVQGSQRAGQRCLHPIILIVNRRRRAGQIVDMLDLGQVFRQRDVDVVLHQHEPARRAQMRHISGATSMKIVDADYKVPAIHQSGA
ncbi:hypothetical protein D3C80_1622880 [compost metagenome]